MRIYGKCSIRNDGRDPEKKNLLESICCLGMGSNLCMFLDLVTHVLSVKVLTAKTPPPPSPEPPLHVRVYIYFGTQVFLSRNSILANALVYEVSYSVI